MNKDFAFLTVYEMIRFLLFLTRQNITIFFDNQKSYKMGRLGRVQSFILILGRVGLDHFTGGSGQENGTHVQLCLRILFWSHQTRLQTATGHSRTCLGTSL